MSSIPTTSTTYSGCRASRRGSRSAQSRRTSRRRANGGGSGLPETASWPSAGSRSDRDVLFLAGVDWRYLNGEWPRCSGQPQDQPHVQGVRHAQRRDMELHRYLSERAIRICVSQEVADAISATGRTNGPVLTIPNGIDVAPFESSGRRFTGGVRRAPPANHDRRLQEPRTLRRACPIDWMQRASNTCWYRNFSTEARFSRCSARVGSSSACPLNGRGSISPRWKPWPRAASW